MGIFGRKSNDANTVPEADPAEEAIDTVAAILRTLGRTVVSVEGTSSEAVTRRFEDWARHVVIRTPAPSREPQGADKRTPDGATTAKSDKPIVRDWLGLQHFVMEHRRTEAALFAETTSGLRETARAFVRAMTRLRVVGDGSDVGVRNQIERLRDAAAARSPAELKRAVLAAADALDAAVAARRQQEESVAGELAEQVKDLSRQLEQAVKESGIDPLTRLANRKTLDETLAETVELAGVTREPVCLVMIDLDDFKRINDVYGHGTGDEVLKRFSDTLCRVVLRQRDLVARFGGDEFCVLLRDCTLPVGKQLMQRVVDAVSLLGFERNGERFGISASFGLATHAPGDTPQSLIDRADERLYEVKKGRKGTIAAAE